MEMTPYDERLLALLDWYRAMGVDEAIGDEPIDWLDGGARVPGAEDMARLAALSRRESVEGGGAEDASGTGSGTGDTSRRSVGASGQAPHAGTNSVPSPARPSAPRVRPAPPTQAPDAAIAAARDAIKSVDSLSALRAHLDAFDGCGLKATAKNTCFYRGAEQARVMFIGEAPGRDEDIAGRPFVGRAGQLLDRILTAAGFGEDAVHITNVVYWRPPGNRTPTPQETLACAPFLEQQIRLVGPDIVVLLGGAAAKTVLDVPSGIMRLRGKWRDVELGGSTRRVIATLHPAYLLRTPAAKRLVWRDMLAVKAELG